MKPTKIKKDGQRCPLEMLFVQASSAAIEQLKSMQKIFGGLKPAKFLLKNDYPIIEFNNKY